MSPTARAAPARRPDFAFDQALAHGRVETLRPGLRRVLANNPGPLTERGTNSWILGQGEVAIIDPGPDDPAHLAALMDATRGERITAILVTHTHADHSGNAPALADATGAATFGFGPHPAASAMAEDGGDARFRPDHRLPDGARLRLAGTELLALHTPGHCSTHLCFAIEPEGLLFTGDHVLAWSTTVITPPDGEIGAYFASLDRLTRRDDRLYLPGHGPPASEPGRLLEGLIRFGRGREARALAALRRLGRATPATLCDALYGDRLDPALLRHTQALMLAHLLQFDREGLATPDGEAWRAA